MKLVKDPAWAKLRSILNNQWSTRAEWCCSKLKNYMGPVSSTTDNKLEIVMEYLSGSGFSGGRITVPCIKKLFVSVSTEVKKRKTKNKKKKK
ncbi:MAG: hypothetical protein ACTSX1_09705 [Candidatus Heimdallarchaeaceae archaeon]